MRIVDATLKHTLDFLREPIREEDIAEWELASTRPVRPVLLATIRVPGQRARALLNEDGLCIAMWGVTPTLCVQSGVNIGGVWLIASKEAGRRAREIHREWRKEVAYLHTVSYAAHLVAVVRERNEMHVKWLDALGFERNEPYTGYPHAVGEFTVWRRHAEDFEHTCALTQEQPSRSC